MRQAATMARVEDPGRSDQSTAERRYLESALACIEARTPGLLGLLHKRWRNGDALLERLITCQDLRSKRYRRAEVIEALIARSRDLQTADPVLGLQLARWAVELSDGRGLESYKAPSWILVANAARLRSRRRVAEEALEKASTWLGGLSVNEGLYCRALGLLRFDEGRGLEAVALLDEAGRCFEASDLLQEACTCWALRSLLDLDLDRASAKTVRLLATSAGSLDEATPPGFASWARMTAAWQLSELDNRGVSRELLANGWREWRLGRLEGARAGWMEGRARRSLGEHREAEKCFREAVEGFEAMGRRFEYTLASWDLAVELARRRAWRDLELLGERFTGEWAGAGELIESEIRGLRRTAGLDPAGRRAEVWLRIVLNAWGFEPGPVLYA